MNETQSFRLLGTTNIVKLTLESVDGQGVVYWDDIEQVFPGVKYVKNSQVVYALKDSDGIGMIPHCIKGCPGAIFDVILTAAPGPHSTVAVHKEVLAGRKRSLSVDMTTADEECSMPATDEKAPELHTVALHEVEDAAQPIQQMAVNGINPVLRNHLHCCPFAGCNKGTRKLRTMARHILERHSNARFDCPHCPKSYKRAYSLKTHLTIKHSSG